MRRALGFWLAATTTLSLLAGSCYERRDDCGLTGACAASSGGSGTGGDTATGGASGNAGASGSSACEQPCDGATPLCDQDSGECVECLDSADCGEATAPRCDAGECVGCAEAADCAGIAGRGLCDEESGACVECLSEDDCPDGEDFNVCSPATRSCTAVRARSKTACRPCTYDAECQANQLCVEMTYPTPTVGVVGTFCLARRPTGQNCGLDTQPFASAENITSVDNEEAIVCTLRTTTCIALLQHAQEVDGCSSTDATSNAACGADTFNDGRCRQVPLSEPAEFMCTYPCLGVDARDCPGGSTCVDDAGDRYCSL